jgi:hypothetical protein
MRFTLVFLVLAALLGVFFARVGQPQVGDHRVHEDSNRRRLARPTEQEPQRANRENTTGNP